MSTCTRGTRSGSGSAQRRGGCAGFLLLPFSLAARVCRPARAGRLTDEGIERAQVARTAIGFVATAWLLFAYPLRESAVTILGGKFIELLISAGLLLVLVPIALAVFVYAARPPGPAFYRARMRGPLVALGGLFGTALLLVLAGPTADLAHWSAWGEFWYVAQLLIGVLYLFALPFGLASAVLCVHHSFRTADVHEVLPPLVSPVLVWAMSAVQLFDAPSVAAPLGVRLLFLAAPPLSVTALSVWELRRLRVRYGVTLRGALGR
ncbi:hypothetical protein ACIOD1_16780 [Streptomyces sp. NPDC088097]|uniref:hypothetical protein n=1 Tax=Streptomyces sp. NPDC088097 TaxID=3365823 RepID=UPI0038166EA8